MQAGTDPRYTNPFYIPHSYEEAVEIDYMKSRNLVPADDRINEYADLQSIIEEELALGKDHIETGMMLRNAYNKLRKAGEKHAG